MPTVGVPVGRGGVATAGGWGGRGGGAAFGGAVGRGGAVGTGTVRMCGLHALPDSGAPMVAAGKSPRCRSSRLGTAVPDGPLAVSLDGSAGLPGRVVRGPAAARRSSDDGSGSPAVRSGRGEPPGSEPEPVRRGEGPGP